MVGAGVVVVVVGLQRREGGDDVDGYSYRDADDNLNRQGRVEESGGGGKTRGRTGYMSPGGDKG